MTADDRNGDRVGGDKITVGDIGGSSNVAIGREIQIGYTAEQVSLLIAEIRREDQPKLWNGRNPYLGLNSFRETDAAYFFGREKLVDELLVRLGRHNFISVVGPSGSGKSSLARAGLFQALSQGRLDGSDKWPIADLTPRNDPIGQLAQAMARVARNPAAAEYLQANGLKDAEALHKQSETLLGTDPRQRLLIFVDQFEELFTQTRDNGVREAFVAQLVQAATRPDGRAIVLLAIRADFVSQCASLPELRDQMNREFQLVGAMAPDELARAIAMPVLEVGASIEPELVAQVIADMKGEPGALPLMQFALQDLFASTATKPGAEVALTLQDYLDRGGVDRALERHADKVLEILDPGEQRIARSVFGQVVEIGSGRADTRRTVAFDELVTDGDNPEAILGVVRTLADEQARLLTTGGNGDAEKVDAGDDGEDQQIGDARTVTIAHERLIDAWPWLRTLIDENREAIKLQNDIAGDARVWDANDRDNSYLYTGARLSTVEEQLQDNKLRLGPTGAAFVEAGIARRRASTRRARLAVAGLVVIALIAIVAALLAVRSSRTALARQLASDARLAVENGQIRLAAFLATESNRREPADHSELWQQILTSAGDYEEVGALAHGNSVGSVTWNPDGRRLASATTDGNVGIWDATNGAELLTISGQGRSGRLPFESSIAWHPDGIRLAIGSGDGTVRIWDTDRRVEIAVLTGGSNWPVNSVAWSPDGERLASQSMNNPDEIKIWNADSGESLANLMGHDDLVLSIAWHPDGHLLASGSLDKTARIWDVASGEELAVLSDHEFGVLSVAWLPDGSRLASGSVEGTVRIWDTSSWEELAILLRYGNFFSGVAWSPDGSLLATGSDDGSVRIWDADSGGLLAILTDHERGVTSVSWHPDGNRLASGSYDETVRIWDGPESNERPVFLHGIGQSSLYSVAWHPDGSRFAGVLPDNTVHIWDARSGEELAVLFGHEDFVNTVAWHPDGSRLASGSRDNTVRIWDAAGGEELSVLSGHDGWVGSLAWHPDGDLLASGSVDKTVRIWDATSGEELSVLSGHEQEVTSLSWHPEGSLLASGSGPRFKLSGGSVDNTVRIWDAISGEELLVLAGHDRDVYTVEWHPDGTRLASGSWDNTVRIWDASGGEELTVLSGHEGYVRTVAWHPDGNLLASGSGDETTRVWDATSGEELAALPDQESTIVDVTWDLDGIRLASSALDGSVHIRDWRGPCQRYLSNLTPKEWGRHMGSTNPYRPTCPNLPTPPISLSLSGIPYPFLTYQGWALAIGAAILVLLILGLALWLVYRLLLRLVNRFKRHSEVLT